MQEIDYEKLESKIIEQGILACQAHDETPNKNMRESDIQMAS